MAELTTEPTATQRAVVRSMPVQGTLAEGLTLQVNLNTAKLTYGSVEWRKGVIQREYGHWAHPKKLNK